MKLLGMLDQTEGAGNYSTLFNHAQNSQFAGTDVTRMTLGQLNQFSDPSGPYGQYVANLNNGTVATPMGRYQVVGDTLRDVAKNLGWGEDKVFDQGAQDEAASFLAQRRLARASTPEAKRKELRNEWHGLRNVPDAELDAAIQELESGQVQFSTRSAPQQDQGILTTEIDTGFTPQDVIARRAEQAANTYNGPIAGATDVGNVGPQDPARAAVGALTQGDPDDPENMDIAHKIMAKMFPDKDKAGRQDALLAIGTGLLSGTNWQDGFAAAGENLMGMRMQDRDQEDRLEVTGAAGSATGFQKVGSVMTPDGTIMGGVSYDSATGEYFQAGPGGQRTVIQGAVPLNNSDASGTRFTTQASNTATAVRDLRGTLASIDKLMPNLQNMNYGVEGMLDDLKTYIKTLSGEAELSEDEIIRRIASGQTQALVGKVREDVVGPGVMTEQDAFRVLSALGGDATSILGNPQVAERMLGEIYDRTLKRYNETHDQYDAYRQFPGSVFQPIERYTSPSAGGSTPPAPGQGEVNIDSILQGYGL